VGKKLKEKLDYGDHRTKVSDSYNPNITLKPKHPNKKVTFKYFHKIFIFFSYYSVFNKMGVSKNPIHILISSTLHVGHH
jgi:hypothetical protein